MIIKKVALVLMLFGTLLYSGEKNENDITELERIIKIVSGSDRVDMLNNLSKLYLTKSVEKSIKYANLALDLSREIPYPKGIVSSQIRIGCSFLAMKKPDESIAYFKKALGNSSKLKKYDLVLSDLWWHYGEAENQLKNYKKAIKNFKYAFKINKKNNRNCHSDTSEIQNGIGTAYYCLKKFRKAIKHFKKAVNIAKSTYGNGHFSTIQKYNNLGLALSYKKKYRLAEASFRTALKGKLELANNKYIPHISSIYDNLAWSLFRQKRFQDALDNYDQAIVYSKKRFGEESFNVAFILNNKARVLIEFGRVDEALDILLNLQTFFQENDNENGVNIAHVWITIGLAYEKKTKNKKAISFYSKAFKRFSTKLGPDSPDSTKVMDRIKKLMMNVIFKRYKN